MTLLSKRQTARVISEPAGARAVGPRRSVHTNRARGSVHGWFSLLPVARYSLTVKYAMKASRATVHGETWIGVPRPTGMKVIACYLRLSFVPFFAVRFRFALFRYSLVPSRLSCFLPKNMDQNNI